MNILLIGSGGREYAIAWKLLQSPLLKSLTLTLPLSTFPFLQSSSSVPIHVIELDEIYQLLESQKKTALFDLVIIANETQLEEGMVDYFQSFNIPVFGPSQAAAQIESSKAFAKLFMQRHGIPSADFVIIKDYETGIRYLETITHSIVIKASGLAQGKGVFLPESFTEAGHILRELFKEKSLGDAAAEVIIEERLIGEEVSLLCFTDGFTIRPCLPARDYKRLLNGNKGPNTGGMGVIAPVALPVDCSLEKLTQTVLQPTIDALRDENKIFVGILYAGLMLTTKGPKVLEFNCRFGDPETQALLPLLQTDLVLIMLACTRGTLKHLSIEWSKKTAVCVVIASQSYPKKNNLPVIIQDVMTNTPDLLFFYAGTLLKEKKLWAVGGRILSITALSNNPEEARKKVYQSLKKLSFEAMQYRTDIGEIDAYAAAGVNIHAGNKAVELMTNAVKSTYNANVLAGIGAFGGMFDVSNFKDMTAPILVASTDGIGTKVELGIKRNRLHTLGFDIVNHSINDILVQGAMPLFFMDYIAANQIEPEKIAALVGGMAEACKAANCALLGGETAEMPGVYLPTRMDVAGTIVGVVEKADALPQCTLAADDLMFGLASSGPHTNGYSLIRQIFSDLELETYVPELNETLADALLIPHRNYLSVIKPLLLHPKKPIKALIHITGGGFYENIPRILPEFLQAQINISNWSPPPLFKLIQQRGNIPWEQMYRVFNMGIGMILVVAPQHKFLLKTLVAERLWEIGRLTSGERKVVFSSEVSTTIDLSS